MGNECKTERKSTVWRRSQQESDHQRDDERTREHRQRVVPRAQGTVVPQVVVRLGGARGTRAGRCGVVRRGRWRGVVEVLDERGGLFAECVRRCAELQERGIV